MRKLTCFTIVLIAGICSVRAQERQQKVESKISDVIVFLSGAQVTRQSPALDIPAGVTQLLFSSLSPDIEAQSIQVKGDGAFTILSVNRQSNFLEEQQASEERSRLDQLIADTRDKIEIAQNQITISRNEEQILAKNQEVATSAAGLDITKLKLALEFHSTRLAELKKIQMEQQKKITALQKELSRQQQQMTVLNGKTRAGTSDIVVKVSAKAAVKGNLVVTYLVKNASWYPTYDLRATDSSNPIQLGYKANVTQRSGEDWKDIKLTLSSGNPAISGNKPEMQPYVIGLYGRIPNSAGDASSQASITAVSGQILDARDRSLLVGATVQVKGTSIAVATDINGNYSLQLPSGAQQLSVSCLGYIPGEFPVRSSQMNLYLRSSDNTLSTVAIQRDTRTASLEELSATSIDQALQGRAPGISIRGTSPLLNAQALDIASQQTQTNIQFTIKDPYSVPSDGKQIAVDIGQYQLATAYEYSAAPKISPDVFLTAKITDFSDLNLLSGEANLFFEGAFLGKSLVNIQNSSDTLSISLGRDKNIVINRERQKDLNDRQLIGSAQRATRDFIIDIKSRKTQAINLVVEDQVPVSNTGEITVEKQELSGGKVDEVSGKVTWKLLLQPNEQKKLELKYQVRYPKNRNIIIE